MRHTTSVNAPRGPFFRLLADTAYRTGLRIEAAVLDDVHEHSLR
jgi:hypothetical protein